MAGQNVLLILTDQHRYDIVGANGSGICRSPALDKFAASGVNFSQAYSCCSLCTPARASLYTGLWPHNHGLTRNHMVSDPNPKRILESMPTLAERLAEVGYVSHFVGKWHAGERMPTQAGFLGMDVPGYGNAKESPYYLDYLRKAGLDKPTIRPVGVGWAHNLMLCGVCDGPEEAQVPYWLGQSAIDLLEERTDDSQSFLLALNFWGPHAPYLPCEPYASMYDPSSIPPWPNFDDSLEGKPPIYKRYRDAFIGEGNAPRSWEECAQWAALYFGYATQIDVQIGRVLDALDRTGLADNTAVLFSCDHGDLTGAHGGMHDKDGMLSQELYHIPMMGRIPGGAANGSVSDLLVSNLDIPATILDIAGYGVPDELDSRSLLPALTSGPPADWPDYVVAEFFGAHFSYEARMVVHNGFKYVWQPGAFDELYDLNADPWELQNLIECEEHAQVLREMRLRLIDWAKASGDELCVLCGLFEQRDAVAPDKIAPYSPKGMDELRTRETRLL